MATQFKWRGHAYATRQELARAVAETLLAEHVSVSTNEMHVIFDDGSALVFDIANYEQRSGGQFVARIVEVCDLSKETLDA